MKLNCEALAEHGVDILPPPSALRVADAGAAWEVETAAPLCSLHGWLLPPRGTSLAGLRARLGSRSFSAKRGQVRMDIGALHPGQPEALTCGFTLELPLRMGGSVCLLEYRDKESGQWVPFRRIAFRRSLRACIVRLLSQAGLGRLAEPLKTSLERAGEELLGEFAGNFRKPVQSRAKRGLHSGEPGGSGGTAGWADPRAQFVPRVTVIIPTKDRLDLLARLIRSLHQWTDYPHMDLMIVDHESECADTRAYLADLAAGEALIVRAGGEFNWSRLNNLAAARADGDILVFLNNDIEVTSGCWLRELVWPLQNPSVGVVGARLSYPDGTIQHAGVVLGLCGVAGHMFRGLPASACASELSPLQSREVSAVTGACMAVRRRDFLALGGFDENLAVSYNDIDFCLASRRAGRRVMYCAESALVHHEGASRAEAEGGSTRKAAATEEARYFFNKWGEWGGRDPFFDDRLSPFSEQPVLRVQLST